MQGVSYKHPALSPGGPVGMIVTCPSCSTRFRVDPARVGSAGRRLKCGRCAHVWHYTRDDRLAPDASRADPPLGGAAPDLDLDRRTDREMVPAGHFPVFHERRRPRYGMVLGWAMLFLALGALVSSLYHFRDAIAARSEAAANIYAGLGLVEIPSAEGFELRGVATDFDDAGEPPSIAVSGELVNTTSGPRTTPRIRLVLYDNADREVKSLLLDVDDTKLGAGEMSRFDWRIDNPPIDAAKMNLYLVARR